MTLRQLYYRVVSAGLLRNAQSEYQRLGKIVTRLREDGTIPLPWVVDHVRATLKPSSWSGLGDFGDSVRECYRLDFWARLPECVEIIVEKDSVAGAIQEVTERYDVALRPCRGYPSVSFCGEIAEEWKAIGKPIYVGYVGDYDPSGFDIERDLREKLSRYSGRQIVSRSIHDLLPAESKPRYVSWQRLGVCAPDFHDLGLIALPVKRGDPRYKAFIAEHGQDCAEVEGIPPTELRRRVEAAILSHVDADKWAKLQAIEKIEQETMVKFIAGWGK